VSNPISSNLESIFNLFVYVEPELITDVALVEHVRAGTEEEKVEFLRAHLLHDIENAKRCAIPYKLSHAEYGAMMRLGTHLELFEQLFKATGAPYNPLFILTPINNGQPVFTSTIEAGAYSGSNRDGIFSVVPDYLTSYMTDEGFNFPKLLDDDYFSAIRILYNARHYVSAAKLLMSFLDTVAFIEFGDSRGNFVAWLSQYVDLARVKVTAEELWEFRNGLLHMTNVDSRKVASGKVARLLLQVGDIPSEHPLHQEELRFLHFRRLREEVDKGLDRWIVTYNRNPEKMLQFVARYDLVISDARVASFPLSRG
jgi:hypothetical protein